MDAEVIVVGAGPAGASTAFHLASRGRQVLLLDRQTFPRDKSCGDGLTPFSVRLLDEMGVLAELPQMQRVRGGRVFMRGRGHRDFLYPDEEDGRGHGLVVPRYVLDDALRRHAVRAGAEFVAGGRVQRPLFQDGAVSGVEFTLNGEASTLRAAVVVAADGASSRLARENGHGHRGAGLGYAIRGYFDGIRGLTDLLELYLPLTDVSDRYVLPSYGWIFPTSESSANIGIGLFERARGENVRELMDRFVGDLRAQDGRFDGMRACGALRGAPLRFDFVPEHCHAPGLLRVGDAAGMVSPFTGEGISYALESGRLAAEVIDRNLKPGRTQLHDLSDYAVLLERQFAGYFEVGRRSARRYQLVWHVLDSTFENEKPLFSLCRQAVLFPEGVGDTHPSRVLDDVGPLLTPGVLNVREDLFRVGEVVMEVVRRDWPFLGRIPAGGRGDPGVPFRPALLLLLASYFGDPRAPHLITVGGALELGYLSALAHLSVEDEGDRSIQEDGVPPANWGNMLAVIAGDFLLTKAYRLCAEAGSPVSLMISEALQRVCEGRLEELRLRDQPALQESAYLDAVGRKTATLFELPCRLGGLLGGATEGHVHALGAYGLNLGVAFQLTDEALSLTGEESRLGRTTGVNLREGIYGLPVLRVFQRQDETSTQLRRRLARLPLTDEDLAGARALLISSGARDETLQLAREFADRAVGCLDALPEGAARLSLSRLAAYAVDRELPARYPQGWRTS